MRVSSTLGLVFEGGLSISISDDYSIIEIPVKCPGQVDKTGHPVISVGLRIFVNFSLKFLGFCTDVHTKLDTIMSSSRLYREPPALQDP